MTNLAQTNQESTLKDKTTTTPLLIHNIIRDDIGLEAVIVIDSIRNGSSIGGCRLRSYDNIESLYKDALL